MTDIECLYPDWPAPPQVRAACTTRLGGVSRAPYAELNVATHVGDTSEAVETNRAMLSQALALPSEPAWLQQCHGVHIVDAHTDEREADASFATRPGAVCVVQTADCLPVLLCSKTDSWIAAVHVGWRGLVAGIVPAAVAAYPGEPEDLLAWLGPAISASHYEVDSPVREALGSELSAVALQETGRVGHWHLDLVAAARWSLSQAGVDAHFGGRWCTYSDARRFYSYRREPTTGRMATLIWLT